MSQEPIWLNSLSSEPAPEIPGEFLAALGRRRQERRRRMAAGVGVGAMVVAVAGAAWVSLGPGGAGGGGTPPEGPRPIAERSGPMDEAPAAITPMDGVVTVALIYGQGDVADLDRLALAESSGNDRQMRIGDHWDPDRVRAWMLD